MVANGVLIGLGQVVEYLDFVSNVSLHICKQCVSSSVIKSHFFCWAPVAHVCNPSYSGGRDQEDLGSKPVQGN
jgi:hypothetical protein